ncbi:hypothetical protein [Pelagicoccus sp. SDUM812003]|uniref:hypothetical protein n=1 Tax=Pelagicoccus sp. SDUM812003 TaxID=3041267 RepID=UPI0028101638|nr:hypothetical protein [Pelagicoccus sp. SDUM812003]MDQ8204768.1 hypothetical protein [Pelagicoccus sp. SDUM812003]
MQISTTRAFIARTLAFVYLPLLVAAPQLCLGAKQSSVGADEALRSTISKLRSDLSLLESDNISSRIQLLQTMLELSSDPLPKESKELASLLERKRSFETELEIANSRQSSPIEDLDRLAPFAKNLAADQKLLRELRNSPFSEELTFFANRAAATADFTRLETLDRALSRSGLAPALQEDVERALASGLADHFRTALASSELPDDDRHSLSVITSRLLDKETAKLAIALQIDAGDAELASLVMDALARQKGHRFELNEASASSGHSDASTLKLKLELEEVVEKSQVTETLLDSQIPGKVTVKENPEFAKAVYLYESANRMYKEELEQFYRYEHGQFLEDLEDIRTAAKEEIAARDEPAFNPGATEDDDDLSMEPPPDANEIVSTEMLVRERARLVNLKQPERPEPPHERLLKNVQDTPSTLQEREDDTPYQYTHRRIETVFATKAIIQLSPIDSDIQIETAPELEHSNRWFQNLDVHPLDASPARSTYSQERKDSARKLFMLEFSADCRKELDKAFDELAEELAAKPDLHHVQLAAAIKLSNQPPNKSQLSYGELLELTRALSSKTGQLEELRIDILKLALSKTDWVKTPNIEKWSGSDS